MFKKKGMLNFQRLRQKVKYSGILRLVHDGLARFGIQMTLFYLVEEGLHLKPSPFEPNEFKEYSLELLNENESDIIASIPEKPYKKETLQNRFKKGNGCLLVKNNDKIIGYTWFELKEYSSFIHNFQLKENEAYLFDAYVLIEYRGKKIAPFMRYQCYKELEKLNRTVFYSISDLLNKQSINFKKKLNARFLVLILYVNLFNKLKFHKQIKKLA